jgi:hypothetical protein
LTGVDTSIEQIELGRASGLDGIKVANLIDALADIKPGTVDVCILFDVLEHFRKDEILSILGGVFAALANHGWVIIHVPNGESPFVGSVFFGDFTHETCFTTRSLSQVLATCGFSTTSCFEDSPVPHGIKSTARWLLWKLFRQWLRLATAVETGDIGTDAIYSRNFLAVARKA